MAQTAVIRAECSYTGHNAVIHAVCYNRHQDCFVSCDDTSLRLWQALKSSTTTCTDLRVVALPPRTSRFLQAITFVDTRQLYVASALDGTLKIFDHEVNELASVFAGRSAILSLAFDSKHSRLFAGGVDGCAAWDVRGKHLADPEAVLNPLYDLAASPTFFHAATPTASSTNTTKRVPKAHDLAWVQSVQLNRDQTRIYAHGKHRIDVFSPADGHHIDTFADIIPPEHGAITAFVLHEKTQYLVCGCVNGSLFVLSVHPTSIVHLFKDHTMAVTGLAVHLSSHLIISSSLDGTVRLWDLEARRQAHRLDIRQPVFALGLLTPTTNPCRFYCRVRSAVQIFTIQSAAKEQLASLSPISILQRVVFPTAATVACQDTVIPGEKLSPPRRMQLPLPSTESDGVEKAKQWIVAAGTDRTIRLFLGRAANEAPSFTWIPEEHTLDVSGLALHIGGNKLFVLLESQKILIVDIRKTKPTEDAGVEEEEKEENNESSRRYRVIDINAMPPSIIGSHAGITSHRHPPAALKKSAAVDGDAAPVGGPHGNTNIAANLALRGAIRSVCCCYYPPIFRSAGAVVGSDGRAQHKCLSRTRTFVNQRQQSKRLDHLMTRSPSPPKDESDGPSPLIQSDCEWIVCGSEFGHLVFWHSGLTDSFQEAISLDAHDASVVAIAVSASSPLCVSLDAGRRVHIWQFQPVFTLRQMVELHEQPSCFVLAPTSEILLTGYDDGAVVFMNVSDSLDAVETLAGSDETHDAMVCGADFLDAKLLVLTASVDAVIKIWDQQKNLLRHVQIAMAVTCLCFMNDDGDMLAGVATGIFMLSKDDLLPDKLPTHGINDASRKGESETASASSPKALPKGKVRFQNKATVRFPELDPIPSDEQDAKQDETSPADRIETDDHESALQQKATAGLPITWKRRNVSENIAVLMGKSNGESTLEITLHPPVLRPVQTNTNQRTTPRTTVRPPSSRAYFPAKDPDWREVIMPSSPGDARTNPFAQRNRRLKPPSESSAIIAELKALASQRPLRSPLSPREESPPTPVKTDSERLGIGHTDAAVPLQYCKHQAPVPPKDKTPRKLWNAIGGEDRRLIAVQRNLPSLT